MKRRGAGECVVENAPQAVQVGANIATTGIACLLRRELLRRAEQLALKRQPAVIFAVRDRFLE